MLAALKMAPSVRKLALAAHLAVSIGWLGSTIAFLALAAASLNRQDEQLVRSAYLAMDLVALHAIVPLAFASLVTGVVMSLGTQWGLFGHWWVVISLVLTALAGLVLLVQLGRISQLAAAARDLALPAAQLPAATDQIVHSGAGLVLLLSVHLLNVHKPRGVTPYGWRRQRAGRALPRPE
ncbi:MAG TPA: hypothetical protein VM305_10850 [Candidatus Limnocylindrales bacterium]|nr:hypothetical protein [Candidatus Limnocylindrales bacterium]